ncbi:MAG: hypothetical protein JXR83_09555 [Deltaproteobacteria bacterium]|nr:hypothetical protein [Deltaproteobacteria bacterium]
MARASAAPFVWVAITALLVVAAVAALQLFDNGQAGDAGVGAAPDAALAESADAVPRTAVAPLPGAQPDAALPPPTPATAPRGLEAYRAQSEEDRRRLGEAYIDLERLWQQGRFGGSGPAARQALEELVEKFGDTQRAACARYLLAKQAIGSPPAERSKLLPEAARRLEQVVESSPEARCDNGARAASLSKLLLATFVYRHDDSQRALSTLRELSEIDPEESDNLGVPIALRARAILTEAGQGDPSWPKPALDAAGVQLR